MGRLLNETYKKVSMNKSKSNESDKENEYNTLKCISKENEASLPKRAQLIRSSEELGSLYNQALQCLSSTLGNKRPCLLSDHEPENVFFQASNLNFYLNPSLESSKIVYNSVRNYSYQIFQEHMGSYEQLYQRAKCESIKQVKNFPGEDATLDEVWIGIFKQLAINLKAILTYTQKLPGFSRLSQCDLFKLVKDNIFVLFGFFIVKLFIDDELYFILPNGVQYTKKRILETMDQSLGNKMIEMERSLVKMKITDNELALLVPYVLSRNKESLNLENIEDLKHINEYYNRAMYKELCVNKRSKEFLTHLSEIIVGCPVVNDGIKDKNINEMA